MQNEEPNIQTILEQLHTTAQFEELQNPNQRLFLSVFAVFGKIKTASDRSGVPRENHYYWMRKDDDYRKAYQTCRDTIAVMVEDSLVEKLIHGWEEPVYQGGQLVGHKRKFELSAMLKYLSKAKPEVFGDKVELNATIEPVSPEAMIQAMAATVPYCPEPEA